ncbi:MAG TPA: Hpt domain-containing protein [Chthoniobacterales bacterium]|jgi:HPt (histidine-containing phosphotransfer) domain-containing protein
MTSPAIDWEQLDMIADGFTPDFVEIYREFEIDLPRILKEAANAAAAGDAVQLARAAHQAKGSAANFGFTGFSGVMARIETQAKAGSVAALASEVETAGGVFRESIALVKRERGI